MVLTKYELETALFARNRDVASTAGLKEENPLDTTEDFNILIQACRRGDLRVCQEQISKGTKINHRDEYDYTPLIAVSQSPLVCSDSDESVGSPLSLWPSSRQSTSGQPVWPF